MRTIPFSRPAVGEEEIEAVAGVLRSGWLTTGEQALAFEEEFAAVVGTPHAMAVNSATAGLHLALEAAGVGPGDSVILPSMTFTATAEVYRIDGPSCLPRIDRRTGGGGPSSGRSGCRDRSGPPRRGGV